MYYKAENVTVFGFLLETNNKDTLFSLYSQQKTRKQLDNVDVFMYCVCNKTIKRLQLKLWKQHKCFKKNKNLKMVWKGCPFATDRSNLWIWKSFLEASLFECPICKQKFICMEFKESVNDSFCEWNGDHTILKRLEEKEQGRRFYAKDSRVQGKTERN